MPRRISLITLGVDDVRRAKAFYEALGWRCSSASVEGEVAFFPTADSVLALWSRQALADDVGVAIGEGFGNVALAINVDDEADVARVLEEVVAAGGRMAKPATRTAWGGITGYFADPDGHVWEVAHNPGFAFGADGSLALPE
ncbi:MAG: VOC family protein [Actinomycetota bacterium]|nr:VOC family protein [Actinomycetota bacterium]